jgi:hypothetical protein
VVNSVFKVVRHGGKSFGQDLLNHFNNVSFRSSGLFGASIVSFPEVALFNFGSKSVSGGFSFSSLFVKESFSGGEFRFGLFFIGDSGGVSSRKHLVGSFKISN